MKFTVVTGLSGSGKTLAARILEDMGYFCIDNMPPALIPKFAEMFFTVNGKFEKVAIVVDIRVGTMLGELIDELHRLKEMGLENTLLFIDADDKTLVKRYKETRRTHPISSDKGLLDSISKERRLLSVLYNEADYVIDTSNLKSADLEKKIKEIYEEKDGLNNALSINVMSFGFKYGLPMDADLVFDVRCFPNPFYIEDLKELTGNDKRVQDYVMSFSDSQAFMNKLYDMLHLLIPLYIEEGKSSLTICIGCTGGKHRSITMANILADKLAKDGYTAVANHRDIMKGKN